MANTTKIVKIVFAFLGGWIANILGGADLLLQVFVYVVIFDYISGVLRAFAQRELSSKVGFKGIAKKIAIFIVVALAVQVEKLLGPGLAIREIVLSFYIMNEGISILENLGEFIKIPDFLKRHLETLGKDNDNKN